jgi:hypothetical protein
MEQSSAQSHTGHNENHGNQEPRTANVSTISRSFHVAKGKAKKNFCRSNSPPEFFRKISLLFMT